MHAEGSFGPDLPDTPSMAELISGYAVCGFDCETLDCFERESNEPAEPRICRDCGSVMARVITMVTREWRLPRRCS